MAFLHEAFTENTAEAREWLESLGYGPVIVEESDHLVYTLDTKNGWKFATTYISAEAFPKNYIDCLGNLPLFKAITALRYDSDYMQWFTNGKDWELCDEQDWMGMFSNLCGTKRYTVKKLNKFHKAAVEELKEHFKKQGHEIL